MTTEETLNDPLDAIGRQPEGQERDKWSWLEIQANERFRRDENEALLVSRTRDDLCEIIRCIRREVWLAEVKQYHERHQAIIEQDFSAALRANERAHEYTRFKYQVDGIIRCNGKAP